MVNLNYGETTDVFSDSDESAAGIPGHTPIEDSGRSLIGPGLQASVTNPPHMTATEVSDQRDFSFKSKLVTQTATTQTAKKQAYNERRRQPLPEDKECPHCGKMWLVGSTSIGSMQSSISKCKKNIRKCRGSSSQRPDGLSKSVQSASHDRD